MRLRGYARAAVHDLADQVGELARESDQRLGVLSAGAADALPRIVALEAAVHHPLVVVEYADIATMNAATYTDNDVGKVYRVNSPLSYWLLLSHSAGSGRPGLISDIDLPASTEVNTGWNYGGSRKYLQRFTGASLANDTLLVSSGVESCLHLTGWNSLAAGSRWPVLYTNAPTGAYGIAIAISGALRSRAAGTFLSQPFDWTVLYTKV
jgi:hypothetical protein